MKNVIIGTLVAILSFFAGAAAMLWVQTDDPEVSKNILDACSKL